MAPGGDEGAVPEGVADRAEEGVERFRGRAADVERDDGDEAGGGRGDVVHGDAGRPLLVAFVGGREEVAGVRVAVVITASSAMVPALAGSRLSSAPTTTRWPISLPAAWARALP